MRNSPSYASASEAPDARRQPRGLTGAAGPDAEGGLTRSGLPSPRVHLEMRIPLESGERDEGRAFPPRQPMLGAAVGARVPDAGHQLSQ